MALRCYDIPQLLGLESIQLRGGVAASGNPVRWPYVAENRSFRPWIKGGELVFVTGISRHRSPQNLAECLYEGKDCGISGLVVLTGDAYIGQLPTTLVRLADELSIPLFEQPYSLPMIEVTEAIGRAILRSEQQDSGGPAPTTMARAVSETVGAETLEELAKEYGPLGKDALLEVADLLNAWLAHQGNYHAMAEALQCHRNTVRNRMNRLNNRISDQADPAESFKSLLLAHLLLRP